LGYETWIDNQFGVPATSHLPYVLARRTTDPNNAYPGSLTYNGWWEKSITAPDQLRQRMAFALSEILVVSDSGVLDNNGRALSDYYDTLLNDAFGNFREILRACTLSPAMGLFLDMRGNDKGNLPSGVHPNENYAREIMQLFSIGLYRLWPDGTLIMDSQGNLVPTYDQNVVMGFAKVFTGWNYYQPNQANGRLPNNWFPASNYTNAMVLVPTHHELGTKLLLDNVVLPAAYGNQTNSANAAFDAYCSQDLESAIDNIFNNQNVGPFICRQLIQRFVTSNPSRDYLFRVVQKFNDDGNAVRGDLKAVLKAILLDFEARSSAMSASPTFGKQREPLLRATALARAFPAPAAQQGQYEQNGTAVITVTTPSPHRFANNDVIYLEFTDSSGQPVPPMQGYKVTNLGTYSFTVNAPGLLSAGYTQSGTQITVTASGHGLLPTYSVYLTFTSGGASNGVYQVVSVPDTSHFTVTAQDDSTRSGTSLLSKWSTGGYTQSATNVTVTVSAEHGLKAGDRAFINFLAGTAADGLYQIVSVPNAKSFVLVNPVSANQRESGVNVYPLAPPALARSGDVTVQSSTFNIGGTDNELTQTPLSAPTVFNFFFPDYKFPGILAAAGLTTPEFQLTTDTTTARQMNFMATALLNTGDTSGLTSFRNNGCVMLDLGAYMTSTYTANGAVPGLVETFNTLLTGGQLAPAVKDMIISYVANTTNFPLSAPPTASQMRNRVRAVVHLILTSPDFAIQK
jgi:hypothetical protein